MFAVLMFIDMGIFSVMAYFYKYTNHSDLKRDDGDQEHEMSARQPGRYGGVDNDGYAGSTDM